MKIYFTASLKGKESYQINYESIVKIIQDLGYEVISDHVIKESSEKVDQVSDDYRVDYYKKMLKWITSSDIVVADLTEQSTSIGHEVTLALEKGKPVIALCYKGKVPNLFQAIREDKIIVLTYEDPKVDLPIKIKKAIKNAQKLMDIRFNFFISPEIVRYLDWVAKVKRVPRSVYLRDLIEDDMKKHKDYGTQG